MLFIALLAPPLAAAILGALSLPSGPAPQGGSPAPRFRRRLSADVAGRLSALLALLPLAATVSLWATVASGGIAVAAGGALRADALSTLLGFCVTLVGALAAWLGPGLWGREHGGGEHAARWIVFSNLFTATMLAAVLVASVGLMWVAIEATTIVSAVLIPLRVTKASVEASWKYILIGSVGIALAFVGTVLAYFDFAGHSTAGAGALNWPVLMAAAPRVPPGVMRLAFVFLLVGYGTKAGLAPMHTWLPDAHSEAPAPLSAMMSGVLLAVAMYAVMRWKAVADLAVGAGFTNALLAGLGLLSLAIAGFSLVGQRNYKRLLAYSSVEHTGLTCLGLALGPLGAFAALLHLLNHSLVKSSMFLLSGRLHARYESTDMAAIRGLLKTMPLTGGLFAAGVMALVGLPPFGLFISEFALLRAGFAAGRPLLMAMVLALVVLVFVSLLRHLNRMLYGTPSRLPDAVEGNRRALIPIGACLAAALVLGLVLPEPVQRLLTLGAEIIAK
jgi:hydrogenase-4 component F